MTQFSTERTLPIVRTHVVDHHTDDLVAAPRSVFAAKPLVVLNGAPPANPSKAYDLVYLSRSHLDAWGLKIPP